MEDTKKTIGLVAQPEFLVPKLCNAVGFTIHTDDIGNKQAIITFSYTEDGWENPILINRVVTTIPHLQNMVSTINTILSDVAEEKSDQKS